MSHCKTTAQEFIQNAFAPQIAILCSEDADNVCLKNNLRFVELLQPFSMPTGEARVSDPSGTLVPIKNFKVYFEDMNQRPPQPILGKKILSEAVSSATWDQEVSKSVTSWTGSTNLNLNLQTTTPWFEEWREIFLQIQYPSDHEFTKHYIACIIVISAGSENPLDQLNRLSQYQHQQQHQNPTRFPKWFSPNILKYYLLLHDVDEVEGSKADQLFEQMISAYGTANCHHLHINSRPLNQQSDANMPDPWHSFLKQRGLVEGNTVSTTGSSEANSGTGTPREDIVGLPSRVTEGDTSEGTDIAHPLSPVAPPMDEKNGVDPFPVDVPLLLNRQTLPAGSFPSQSHGTCLTSSDVDRIKIFIDEFCLRALIPYVERQIRYLNDVVTNRSRSKSLLSATRRWLGGSKSAAASTNSVVYSQEATELQTRRLGDLCFMFGLYEQAYNAYYTAKNDFKSDQAWLYFAGAQEMAALSSFMQNQNEYPKRYFEGSLHTYLNVCKVYNFAIRLTLLSTEVLKSCQEFGESAMIFIKMTSEESDLLSALMLEQAAHCFINSKKPLPRKYAFHMTLAGHRFSKAGQRAHSLRAYKQAFQVYLDHGWILAEDHIHYTMGKQAFLLKLNQESLEATTRLIDQGAKKNASTRQSSSQQLAYMREFLNILDKYLREEQDDKSILSLPVPVLNGQNTKVLIGDPIDTPSDKSWCSASHLDFSDEDFREKRWFALEREVVSVAQGNRMIFKPNLHRLTSSTPNLISPVVPVKERISLQIHLKNPLLISLTLSFIRPVYSFFDEQDTLEDPSCAISDTVSGFNMPPDSEQVVVINIWPQKTGRIHITGIAYKISLTPDVISAADSSNTLAVEIKQNIEVRGPRLNNTLQERCNIVYAKDERLNIKVVSPMPRLSVVLENPPSILSCGEIQQVKVRFKNEGQTPMCKLYVGVTQPQNVFFSVDESQEKVLEVLDSQKFKHVKGNKNYDCVNRVKYISLPNGVLNPSEVLSGHLWLHAPIAPCSFDVELLFFYESTDLTHRNRYRLVRHLSSIYLYPSISLKVKGCRSAFLLNKEIEANIQLPYHRHSSSLVFHIKNKCEIENSVGKIELIGVSVNSSYYGLVPVPNHLQVGTIVDVNQSCQLCVQCIHVQEKKPDDLVLSYISLESSSSLPNCWWEFSVRERLKLPELLVEAPPPDPKVGYDPPPLTQNQIDGQMLREALDLDIVATVIWKGERGDEKIIGQHSEYLDQFTEEKEEMDEGLQNVEECPPVRIIKEEETPFNEDPVLPPISDQHHLIKVSLSYPKEISHNFKDSSVCRINYLMHFYNSSACTHLAEVEFASKAQSIGGGQIQMFSPEASMNLLAVGASTKKFRLEGFQSKTLSVYSVVTRPGTYSLGALALKIRRDAESSEWVPQVCKIQSGILVRNESSTLIASMASLQALSLSES